MDGIEWSASGMEAAQKRLEISAANLANAHADGFRAQLAHVHAGASGLTVVSESDGHAADRRPTGRSWDLAVVGGSLRVKASNPRGYDEVAGGRFYRDPDGVIRNESGAALLGTHGVIRVPADAFAEPDGRIVLDGTTFARIPLARGAHIERGMLPASNVDSIGEMVRMLDAQRSFETSEKVLEAVDEARQKSVSDVGVVK